jgi:hypothetical protein
MSHRPTDIELPESWIPGNLCETILRVVYNVAWAPLEVRVFYPEGEELAKSMCGAYVFFSPIPLQDPKYIGIIELRLIYDKRRDCYVFKYELYPSLVVSKLQLESLVNQIKYLLRTEGIMFCEERHMHVKWHKIVVE